MIFETKNENIDIQRQSCVKLAEGVFVPLLAF